nr:unnamed protein product [Digitaria exilis]
MRSSSSTCTRKLLLAMAFVALLITAAHGARTEPRGGAPGSGGGAGVGAPRRSALDVDDSSLGVPSCCTHDPNTGGKSCCPQTPTP